PTPFLLTGITGGLGHKILTSMLHTHHIPPTSIIATSRHNDTLTTQTFESQNLLFRHADYTSPSTLTSAFQNVQNLLFVSSSERDSTKRIAEHRNVIDAAKKADVKRVWYVSLGFGGWGDGSKIKFQHAHYETEKMLRNSGLEFVSLRAGVYADAFPLFLNWYPESEEVLMPNIQPAVEEGRIAFTSREELGEVIAKVLVEGLGGIQPRGERRIVLLTAMRTYSLLEIVEVIGEVRGRRVKVRYLEPEEWIRESAKGDIGGKSEAWFQARLVFFQGICNGDAEVTDSAMMTLLGREPETGVQTVKRLLKQNPEYRWHQNH
ncbi:uncharacterized protein MYCFIDRAFT_120462, partial [Pseudocercospora fijiensis CIRAD86]